MLIHAFVFAQAPQGIPYQAVMRNADGSVMASSAVNLIFMIHDGEATGAIVYQESHALTSNAQGLVSCVVGSGVVSQGNFANVNWGGGAKFLHVMMGSTDLGTQQMWSVPYALYAEKTGEIVVNVSASGDTLFIGQDNFVVIPGLSLSYGPQGNSGLALLPGNDTCDDQYISVTGCGGQDSLSYDGHTYDLFEIGGQCWFADNLATDQYRNGDPIPTGLDNASWSTTTNGAYSIYNNDAANDVTYGKLYNWYSIEDTRGICPTDWHVPTECEWMYLESKLGMSPWKIEEVGSRGTDQGGKLKAYTNWNSPNTGATNTSGFTGLPGGFREYNGIYSNIGKGGNWWTSAENGSSAALFRALGYNYSGVLRAPNDKRLGYSVRCVRD